MNGTNTKDDGARWWIDTHLHLLYPERLHYDWTTARPELCRPFHLEDYLAAAKALAISGALHMEVDVRENEMESETALIGELAARPACGIVGAIAACRPETAERAVFAAFAERALANPLVRGFRHVLHTMPDDLSTSADFRANVRRLTAGGHPFDVCALPRQLPHAAALAEALADSVLVLDHCGIPDVAGAALDPWRAHIAALARHDNVYCKISGIIAYGNGGRWPQGEEGEAVIAGDLRPFVEHVIDCFGWRRVLWGSDFPVCTLTRALATARRWDIARVFASLDETLVAASAASAVFDLALPPQATLPVLERLPQGSAVLMQKPMGADLDGARAIVDCCRRRRLVAAVNHQLRFAPYMLALRDALRRGWLGQPTDVEMQLNVADPWHLFPFLEALERVEIQMHSIHYLDLIRSLLGEPLGVHALTLADARFPRLKSTRSSIILNYGAATRVCLSLNHNYAHGAHRQAATFKFEGDAGVVWLRLGVMLDYPVGQPDLFEIKRAGTDWETLELRGSWFPDAFNGPMSNLQRFVADEEDVLLTRVDYVLDTMRVVEAAYESSAGGGVPLARFAGDGRTSAPHR